MYIKPPKSKTLKREYTITLDLAIKAKDETEALFKLSRLINNKYRYWVGGLEETTNLSN